VIRINLLPYREARRRAAFRWDIRLMLVTLGLVSAGLGGWYWQLQDRIRIQQQRLDYLRGQLAELEQRSEEVARLRQRRRDLQARLGAIRDLHRARSRPVELLQTAGRAVPKGVTLRRLEQDAGRLHLEGEARSNGSISSFMRRLEAAEVFGEPTLEVIRDGGGSGSGKDFRLEVSLSFGGSGSEPASRDEG
jgi:type IV pilus assembly protein PilN